MPLTPSILRILGILVRIFLVLAILELVRRGKLRERYSLLLLLIGSILLCLPLFGRALARAANSLGIRFAPSLLVSVTFVVTFVVQIVQAVIISSLSLNTRDLAQKVAELEWRIGQLHRYARMLEEEQQEEQVAVQPAIEVETLTSTGEGE